MSNNILTPIGMISLILLALIVSIFLSITIEHPYTLQDNIYCKNNYGDDAWSPIDSDYCLDKGKINEGYFCCVYYDNKITYSTEKYIIIKRGINNE